MQFCTRRRKSHFFFDSLCSFTENICHLQVVMGVVFENRRNFFCNSLIQSFLNFYFWEKNMFADYLLGHWSIKKITNFQKYWKNTLQESCTKKDNFAPGAASHTFFDSPCITIVSIHFFHFCSHFSNVIWIMVF